MNKDILDIVKEEMNKSSFQKDKNEIKRFLTNNTNINVLESDNEELQDMKRWISSLSIENLLSAMEFSCRASSSNLEQGHHSNINESHNIDNETGNFIRQDFDLLKQMIQLQAPLPTPIHPRAVSFKPATKLGINDGQNEEIRKRRTRFVRPRLFQLIERNPLYSSIDDYLSLSKSITTNNKKSTAKNRKTKNVKKYLQYDIIVRRFISPWGEHLSVGLTENQRTADEMMVKGTKILKNQNGIPTRCIFCNNMITQSKSNENSTSDILKMLNIASRGRFLSKLRISQNKNSTNDNGEDEAFAPWFQPNEWFSLSTYLVNCFEIALWDHFDIFKKHHKMFETEIHHPIIGIMAPLPNQDIVSALLNSMRLALSNILKQGSSSKFLPRDHLLWNLLNEPYMSILKQINHQNSDIKSNHKAVDIVSRSILSIPIIELGSSLDTFTTSIYHFLRTTLAAAVEARLLNSMDSKVSIVYKNENINNKSNNKKKKKKKQKRAKTQVAKMKMETNIATSQTNMDDFETQNKEQENTLQVNVEVQSPPPPISVERNKNTMIALIIIEEVLEKVCNKLGLGSCGESKNEKEKIHNQDTYTVVSKEKKSHSNELQVITLVKNVQKKENGRQIKNQNGVTRHKTEENGRHYPDQSNGCQKSIKEETGKQHTVPHASHRSNQKANKEGNGKIYFEAPKVQKKVEHEENGRNHLEFSNVHPKVNNIFSQHGPNGVWCKSDIPSYLDTTSGQANSDNGFAQSEHSFTESIDYRPSAHNLDSIFDQFSPSYFDAVTLKASGAFDGWLGVKQLQRQKSLFAEFFTDDTKERDETRMASSTAASIASSSGDDEEDLIVHENEDDNNEDHNSDFDNFEAQTENNTNETETSKIIENNSILVKSKASSVSSISSTHPHKQTSLPSEENKSSTQDDNPSLSAPSSHASSAPAAKFPPFLISLADLPRFRQRAASVERATAISKEITKKVPNVAGSLPSSPIISPRSHDDLRINFIRKKQNSCRDLSHRGRGNSKMTRKSFLEVASSSVHDISDAFPPKSRRKKQKSDGNLKVPPLHIPDLQFNTPALSDETHERLEVDSRRHDESETIPDRKREVIGDAQDSNNINILSEERNCYRDMCLTLGAEVAKLNNLLASERGVSMYPMMLYPTPPMAPYPMNNSSFDAEFMAPFFQGSKAAMSDVGIQRHDHESTRSEDGTDIMQGATGGIEAGGPSWKGHQSVHSVGSNMRSDSSIEQRGSLISSGFRPLHRDPLESTPFHGLQSRLSDDIYKFLQDISLKLKKQDVKRKSTIDRLTKIVKALWPRAQIKQYGSHVSNLCLPSSDLDFIICLPAVHKNAPAATAGVLEGRNAINETWQKLLARKLKGESWLDPRSIKLIERTVVPVIKVSTKDTKAHVLQLDISFDGPDHNGLEAAQMVTEITQELPMVRPILLVLKHFLRDRGLLTAYTGGLSAYCLFLMVTRYLQEQPLALGDCGSLLMGFLDFYGNNFDPGSTGISVARRQYFSRQNYDQITHTVLEVPTGDMQPHVPMNSSFGMKTSGVLNRSSSTLRTFFESPPQQVSKVENAGRPFSFDPLFVEDPLCTHNNVGRNAFRIHQIKRAFSDVHRALVASLEWDLNSSDPRAESEYPLLNCLLRSEDVFYEFDEWL